MKKPLIILSLLGAIAVAIIICLFLLPHLTQQEQPSPENGAPIEQSSGNLQNAVNSNSNMVNVNEGVKPVTGNAEVSSNSNDSQTIITSEDVVAGEQDMEGRLEAQLGKIFSYPAPDEEALLGQIATLDEMSQAQKSYDNIAYAIASSGGQETCIYFAGCEYSGFELTAPMTVLVADPSRTVIETRATYIVKRTSAMNEDFLPETRHSDKLTVTVASDTGKILDLHREELSATEKNPDIDYGQYPHDENGYYMLDSNK